MKVLELFCGTKSVGKLLEHYGYEVVSLDFNKKFKPTICCDILEFDYKKYKIGEFDIIWASPDCRYYSCIQRTHKGKRNFNLEDKLIYADSLVKKTFEIIEYLKPDFWFIENPQTGTLKNRDVMKGKPYYDADYCMYSEWGYRKRTRFWTNRVGLELKLCNKKCGNMTGTRHNIWIGMGGERVKRGLKKQKNTTKTERYRIPEKLLKILLFN